MATIPLPRTTVIAGGGERPVPRADPGAFGDSSGLATLGRTISDAGFGELAVQQDQRIQAQREAFAAQKKAKEDGDRVLAVTAKAHVENDLADLKDVYANGVLHGQFANDAEDANGNPGKFAGKDPIASYKEAASKVVATRVSDLPDNLANFVSAESIRSVGTHANSIGDVVTHRQQQDVGANLLIAGDEFGRMAERDRPGAIAQYENVVDKAGPMAGWDPTKIAKEKASFREATSYNSARMLVLNARDNVDSLTAAGKVIQSDRDLSPDKLAPLLTTLEQRKQTVIQKQAAADARTSAAEERRVRDAGIAVDGAQKIIDNGGGLDPQFALQVAQQVQGTPYASMYQQLTKTAGDRAGFATQSPAAQRAKIDAMRADANARGTDPEFEKRIDVYQSLFDKGQKALADDGLRYGADRGLIPAVAPLHADSIDAFAKGLAARTDSARTVSAATGQPVSPLSKVEANAFVDMVGRLPVASRAGALRLVSQAINDPQQVSALASQLGEKNRPISLALFAGAHQTTFDRPISELILRGADADSQGRIKSADVSGDMREIAQTIGQVPWPTSSARDAAVEAAQLVHKGRYDEGNGGKGSAPEGGVSKSIRLATGGVVDWAGAKTVLPFGATEDSFKSSMKTLDAQQLQEQVGADHVLVRGQSVPIGTLAAGLSSTKMIPVGDGVYVLQSGNALVQKPNGEPFRLRVR